MEAKYGAAYLSSESPNTSEPPKLLFYLLSGIACLNGCNLGYDVGSAGGAAVLMREQMGWTEVQTETYVGCINLVAAAGGLVAGPLCDRLGRRGALILSSITFILAISLVASSADFVQAMIGRVILGGSVGLALTIGPLYVSEIAPPDIRGACVSCVEISICFGILMGFAADFILIGLLPDDLSWRCMVGGGVIIPLCVLVLGLTVMLESPRWLIVNGRKDEAIAVLSEIYPATIDFVDIADKIESNVKAEVASESQWVDIFMPKPAVRRMLLAGIGVNICQQINGSESLVYYSPVLLEKAGVESREQEFAMTIFVGLAKVGFILVAVLVADNYGRRPLLLTSTLGMALCLIGLGFAASGGLIVLQICLMCTFMAFFAVGVGPCCWIVSSEVFSNPIRAKGLSLGCAANRVVSGIVSITALTLTKRLGIFGFFMFYAGLTFASVGYIYIMIPETKGRTLEEIEDSFHSHGD